MAAKSKRGFASMDRDLQRQIARKGGRAVHAKGTAHEFTSEEARQAGRQGGKSVSKDKAHMSEIGRRGGLISGRRRATASRRGKAGTNATRSGRSRSGVMRASAVRSGTTRSARGRTSRSR